MTDAPQPAAPQPTVGAKPARRFRTRTKLIIAVALLSPAIIFGVYTFATLTWNYSEGERAGVLQKFSRKGWLCKSYEGELAMTTVPGVAPTIWAFSVREDSLVTKLREAVGQNVRLHYREHRGVPTTCFGETNYYVDGLSVVGR
jgi:hypothetical protein